MRNNIESPAEYPVQCLTFTMQLSMEEVVMDLSSPSTQCDQLELVQAYHPPTITYSVQAASFPPVEQLDCTIQVSGASSAGGKTPFFNIHSNYCNYPMKGKGWIEVLIQIAVVGTWQG